MLPERLPRHNGGFSNPSRNAEIFRLKRELLKEYYASVQDDDREAAMFDALIGRSAHPTQQPSWASTTEYGNQPEVSHFQAPVAPRERRPLPKYKPVKVGDEDFMPLTGDKPGSLTLDERVKYVSSLWPGLAPVDDDEDIMDYYGIEVQIISEEEREKELAADNASNGTQKEDDVSVTATAAAAARGQPTTANEEMKEEEAAASGSETTGPDTPSSPELSVKTRSAALQKLKEAAAEDDDEIKPNPIATKQDDWVQCDKCQKWRRLPSMYSRASSGAASSG
ncbi:unnamed protein product [Phytophthora lilii]|uniref:Unnamed protein product n=1 Tax=Phytophthora lilii TaxID=2077276 RepID=A0A9W6WPA6_9STRA|nr:unnamed protein product [Phytophthora lilii]